MFSSVFWFVALMQQTLFNLRDASLGKIDPPPETPLFLFFWIFQNYYDPPFVMAV